MDDDKEKVAPENDVRVSNSLLVAGQMMGLSWWLDADILENFLDKQGPDSDFRYGKQCRAAIKFKRAIDKA